MSQEDNSGREGGAEGEHAIVECATTSGSGQIVMQFYRDWSPNGYDRATALFERHYYDQSHFFRVVPHFLVQFGISYTKDENLKRFADSRIHDDPKREDLMPFREGMMSFAGSGPNSRNSQLFIAYDKAGNLGESPWETPFGEVMVGMENVRNLYSGYGDMPPWGKGPQQGPIRNRGASYIENDFPLLDKFETCTVRRVGSAGEPDVGAMGDDHGDDIAVKEDLDHEDDLAVEEDLDHGDDIAVVDDLDDTPSGKVEEIRDRPAMRGVQMKAKPEKHLTPTNKLAFIVMAVILALLLCRRKKSKHALKDV